MNQKITWKISNKIWIKWIKLQRILSQIITIIVTNNKKEQMFTEVGVWIVIENMNKIFKLNLMQLKQICVIHPQFMMINSHLKEIWTQILKIKIENFIQVNLLDLVCKVRDLKLICKNHIMISIYMLLIAIEILERILWKKFIW